MQAGSHQRCAPTTPLSRPPSWPVHTRSSAGLGAPPEQGLRSSLRGQAPRRGRGARGNLASDSLRGPQAAALGEPLRGPCPGHASPPPERPDPTGTRSAKSSPPAPAALGPAGPGAGPRRSEAAEVARRAAECSGNEKPPLSRGHRGRELRRAATPGHRVLPPSAKRGGQHRLPRELAREEEPRAPHSALR